METPAGRRIPAVGGSHLAVTEPSPAHGVFNYSTPHGEFSVVVVRKVPCVAHGRLVQRDRRDGIRQSLDGIDASAHIQARHAVVSPEMFGHGAWPVGETPMNFQEEEGGEKKQKQCSFTVETRRPLFFFFLGMHQPTHVQALRHTGVGLTLPSRTATPLRIGRASCFRRKTRWLPGTRVSWYRPFLR